MGSPAKMQASGPCAWCNRTTSFMEEGEFVCQNGEGCARPITRTAANDMVVAAVATSAPRSRGRLPGSTNSSFTVRGATMSLTRWANHLGISYRRLDKLIKSSNVRAERMIEFLLDNPPKILGDQTLLEVDGEMKTFDEWAAKIDTTVAALRAGAYERDTDFATEVKRRLDAPKRKKIVVELDQKVTVDGETKTFAEWVKILRINPKRILADMFQFGTTIEEEIDKRFNVKFDYSSDPDRIINVDGQSRTFGQWAVRLSSKISTIRFNARQAGRSIEEEIRRRVERVNKRSSRFDH